MEIYQYKMDKDLTLSPYNKTACSFSPSTPLLIGRKYEAFVDVVTKNKTMYEHTARKEKAKIQKDHTQKIVKLLQDIEFPPYVFKLDQQYTLPLALKVVNIISLRYESLSL